MSRRHWFASLFLEPSSLDLLRHHIRSELPSGQARVALGLICLPEDPVAYTDVAAGLRIGIGTVHTHMRRIRLGHPELYGALMAERQRQFRERHLAVLEERAQRSLEWGRRRYAARYRAEHGRWPWQDLG